MYLLKKDVDNFELFLSEFTEGEKTESYWELQEGSSIGYFFKHPHLILPLGFDETRHLVDEHYGEFLLDEYNKAWIKRAVLETKSINKKYGLEKIPFDFGIETIFRSESQGAWYWFYGLENEELIFLGSNGLKEKYNANDLLKRLRTLTEFPDYAPKTMWLPRIWTPEFQDSDRQSVSNEVSGILRSLQDESYSLRDIKPTVLEELIAELLRSRGMEVFVTKKTRDGGRDIIGKTETVMGDPLSFAIEVKQKEVVGIEDVRAALKANEHFPALMVATSGRFSSGVVQEKRDSSNTLRLMLKDGVALSQWIDTYAKSNYT